MKHSLSIAWALAGLLCVLAFFSPAAAGAQTVTLPDPLAHYDFEDDQDLGADSSLHARNGQAFGGAQQTAGRHGAEHALKLDGTGWVEIPNQGADLEGLSELSVEAWVRMDAHDTNIFRTRQPVGLGSDRVQVSNYVDGSGWETLIADPAPPLGRWYHLVGVFENGALRLYVDGERNAEIQLPFTESDGTAYAQWALGGRVPGGSSSADQLFVGEIDDVRIYDAALTDQQVKIAANRRPVASNDTGAASSRGCAEVDVTANDKDPDGDALTVTITGAPANGTASLVEGSTIRYCPSAGFTGTDTVTYELADPLGAMDSADLRIDVGVPSFLSGERTVQVLEQGTGWQRLRMYDPETEAAYADELLAVWSDGVDSAPLSAAQKDELEADFEEAATGISNEAGTPDLILIDLTALDYIEQQQAAGMTVPTDPVKGCFGWNDKEKTKTYNINEWSHTETFELTDHVTGEYSVNVPLQGQATFKVRYRIKEAFCVPYKFRFKDVHAYGNVSVDGGSDLGASIGLAAQWDKEWHLFEPELGETTVWLGPIPVYLKFTLPVDVGLDLNARVTGSIGVDADFHASGSFDYTCTKSSCTGTSDLQDNFSTDQLTAGLEVEADAKLYGKVQVKMAVYHESILFVQAGVKPYVEAQLWGYYGNNCGDADDDGQNETVQALVAGADAGYDIVYGWGGVVSDQNRTITGQRFYLGWWDLLGQGGSTALSPMLHGPSVVDRGVVTPYTVKMRPCYPYEEAVTFAMLPGTWQGETVIPEPQSSDPALSESEVSRAFPTAQAYDLRVTAVSDAKGRPLRASTDRRIRALDPQSPPVITSQPQGVTVLEGRDASFSVTAEGGSLNYRWQKNGVDLSDGGIYSGASTSQLSLTGVDAGAAGNYRVRVYNDAGSATSATAGLTVLPPAPEIASYRAWDGGPVPHGSYYDFEEPVVVGIPESRRFEIRNQGTADLVLSNPGGLVSGACFLQIETPISPIPAGSSGYVRVRLHCATAGEKIGQVTIESNDPNQPVYTFHVRGTVISDVADIAVAQMWDGAPIPDGGSFTFPDPTPVGTAVSRAFLITNEGASDLVLSNAASLVSGPCYHQIETPTTVIAPLSSSYVRVRLHCATAGTYTGAVTIQSNDPVNPTYTFSVTGTVSP